MKAVDYFDEQYRLHGAAAQRRYPSEDLVRFLSRRFPNRETRRTTAVLDVGCGAGVNLKMMRDEGFLAYGIDASLEAVELALSNDCDATMSDMCKTTCQDGSYSAVVDVFSSYCLSTEDFVDRFLPEVRRVLKPGGRFFSLTPSVNSFAYARERRSPDDEWIVDGVYDDRSPYAGNNYSFRFADREFLRTCLGKAGFDDIEIETLGRTYRNGEEYFEMLAVDARAATSSSASPV